MILSTLWVHRHGSQVARWGGAFLLSNWTKNKLYSPLHNKENTNFRAHSNATKTTNNYNIQVLGMLLLLSDLDDTNPFWSYIRHYTWEAWYSPTPLNQTPILPIFPLSGHHTEFYLLPLLSRYFTYPDITLLSQDIRITEVVLYSNRERHYLLIDTSTL